MHGQGDDDKTEQALTLSAADLSGVYKYLIALNYRENYINTARQRRQLSHQSNRQTFRERARDWKERLSHRLSQKGMLPNLYAKLINSLGAYFFLAGRHKLGRNHELRVNKTSFKLSCRFI